MRQEESTGSVNGPSVAGKGDTATEPMLDLPLSLPARRHQKQLLSLGLIDPRPLTRHSISGTLAKALPEFVTVAVPSCEELIEKHGRPQRWLGLVMIHIRSAQLTNR